MSTNPTTPKSNSSNGVRNLILGGIILAYVVTLFAYSQFPSWFEHGIGGKGILTGSMLLSALFIIMPVLIALVRLVRSDDGDAP